MALDFPAEWRFADNPVPMPDEAVTALAELAERIAAAAQDKKDVYETVKGRFGVSILSSSTDWAQTDMHSAFGEAKGNAAVFVDSFWAALCDLRDDGVPVPSAAQVNSILSKTGAGYQIDGTSLRRTAALLPETTPVGAFASGYILGPKLGFGGFGEVFQATRHSGIAPFEFAIKIHRPSAFTSGEKALKRFEREIRALQKLQHRGIVPYLDAGFTTSGEPFLVMPLIRGTNIRDAAGGNGSSYCVEKMAEIARALVYAHSQQVLHRDLKPRNILVRESDGQPIVLDFGLAYVFEDASQESLTTTGIGTLPYIPHEVILDPKQRTVLHDVYSCGVILYELLARRLPDARDYSPLAALDKRLAPVDRVVHRALAPSRDRYQSMGEFLTDLETINGKSS